MKQKNSSMIELTKDELRLILNGLQSEKQTMFLGSTKEQYEEYHDQIEELYCKILVHRRHIINYNALNK